MCFQVMGRREGLAAALLRTLIGTFVRVGSSVFLEVTGITQFK